MSGLAAVAEKGFEVGSYLDQRAIKPGFVMIEIGHGGNPIVHNQPFEFTDDRAYIGIEGWLRYPEHKFKEDPEYKEREGKNIFFISQKLGVEVCREGYEESSHSWLEGEYDPVTILPDEAGDEIVLINVLSDRHIERTDRAEKLLREAGRLAATDGMVVVKEVITPQNSCIEVPGMIESAGLEVAKIITPDDDEWNQLELVYMSDEGITPEEGSHYLFLSKT